MLTIETMNVVLEFFWNVRRPDFLEIFGERVGLSLWEDYCNCMDMDALHFMRRLDETRFKQLIDAINGPGFVDGRQGKKMSNKKHQRMHGAKPTPQHLKRLITEHGNDLLAWPERARMWLVSDPEAGDYIREHVPGMEISLAESVGEWYQMSLLGIVERDGSEDNIPF
jgi:hypothetical protein